MTVQVLDYQSVRGADRRPISGLAAAGYVIGGIITPFIGLVLGGLLSVLINWQSGVHGLIGLGLHPVAAFPFYVIAIYASMCMLLILMNPLRWVVERKVRAGIYFGLALNLQYPVITIAALLSTMTDSAHVIESSALYIVPGMLLADLAITVSLLWLTWTLKKALGVVMASVVLAGALLLFSLLGLAMANIRDMGEGFAILLPVMCLPTWPLVAYASMSRLVWRMAPMGGERPGWLAALPWVGAYVSACAVSITMAILHYNSLPTSYRAISYVATAAAKGHRRFVGTRAIGNGHGGTLLINRQLRLLICAEIALHVLWPGVGKMFRRGYDVVGPALAGMVVHPLIADLTYLLLKPLEWCAWLLLRMLFARPSETSSLLYCAESHEP